MRTMNLLVTLDENYLPPLCVLLKSIFINNPEERFRVYMIYDSIRAESVENLSRFCAFHGSELYPITAREELFSDAPVTARLPRAMDYRLLARYLLPEDLGRILYLDPDIIVINPLRELYDTDFGGALYAGASHTGITGVKETVNKVRLQNYELSGYINPGVLLLNLGRRRAELRREDIFRYIAEHRHQLILPDQDILNGLYADRTLLLDDSLYNYDARRYEVYRIASEGVKDLDWVMENTVILHFCGKAKPWDKTNRNRFGLLYKHYASMAAKTNAAPYLQPPGDKEARYAYTENP